jgi:LacI family transcriptional regulator
LQTFSVTTPSPTPPTLLDVASLAGVSTATVSRALNKPHAVRPDLRARVQAAVASLGYVANAGARAMTLRRSGTVGVVVPTIDNAIFASGLQAFQSTMAARGYHVLLAFSDYDPEQEMAQVKNLLARGVDALALTGLSQKAPLLDLLSQRGLPWVHTGSFPARPDLACVGFRNREAMSQAVRYLMDLGHRNIAMLAGITHNNDRATERVEAVRQALLGARLALTDKRLVEAVYSIPAAREGVRALLAPPDRATAIVCGNDVLAYGVLLECQAQGIAVPAQLSVVGFDDLDLSRHWHPGLTTMHVPTELMWERAANYLVDRLELRLDAPVQLEIAVELIVRGSSGPPPARSVAPSVAPRKKARSAAPRR